MTEFDIQDSLFERFKTLDDFAAENGYDGDKFFEKNEKGEYINVHFPNEPFKIPEDKRWFDINCISNEPEAAALMGEAQNRYTGVLYIDINAPQDCGEAEARNKYEWIARLFTRDLYFDSVAVMKCYVATKGNDADHYRLQCAVEWTADIDKE